MLTVFSLNIVVGFACSVGLDMGFNSHHHDHEEEATEAHVHANDKKHHHEKQEYKHTDSEKKDDCCNDKVLKISQTEKAIPQTAKLLSPVFFPAFVSIYYNINLLFPAQVKVAKKYFELGYDPPGSEIRIFIKCFQI